MLLEVTESNIDNVTGKSGLVIVDFWNPWCGPCNMLNPVIKRLAENNADVTIGKLNTTENMAAARKFNIDAIPTILFFKDGNLVKKLLGYHNENVLQNIVNQLK
jgi:thioredoxin 1